MILGSSSRGAWELSQSGPHDEFLELCAASITGDLSDEEQKRLQEHLPVCGSCREVLRQYESIATNVMPAVAATETPQSAPTDPAWSQEKAEKALFDRLSREEKDSPNQSVGQKSSPFLPPRIFPFSSPSTWRNVWMLYAAGILLFCALSFFAYRVGMRRVAGISKVPQPQLTKQENLPSQTSLEEELSDAGHDRAVANAEIARRDRVIADLRRQMTRQTAEINELKSAQIRLESDLRADESSKQDLAQQKTELARKLESAEHASQSMQEKLDSLAQQSAEDTAHAKMSDARVNDLTRQLEEEQAAVKQRDDLLSHDRDIRELMGARDLYMTEIYDVAGTGETKKPYGRLFYTRGKSLIFYAYDLDQQTGLKRAATFQAWGRRGPDAQQAINLGVFYQDNETKKRWILKCNDPKTLAEIDGVFVTVEPRGGSHKPTSKTLLFASLKVEPNHP
jgi:hypothetical protein